MLFVHNIIRINNDVNYKIQIGWCNREAQRGWVLCNHNIPLRLIGSSYVIAIRM